MADELIGQGLTENNKVYLDLLFNQVYLGTDDDGNRVEPFKDKKKKRKKNIRKSGGGSKAYRLRRILERLSAIKDACGVARLIWGLPTLRYVDECCCKDNQHLNNIKEEEIGEIYNAARANSRYCLLAAFPGCTILDPIMAFKGGERRHIADGSHQLRGRVYLEGGRPCPADRNRTATSPNTCSTPSQAERRRKLRHQRESG